MTNLLQISRSPGRVLLLIVLFALLIPSLPLFAGEPVHVAVLDLENMNRDPRYDYLEGMILGVLMYDLIRVDDVTLVERALLDRIIGEQGLRLTGLLSDTDTAKQIGQLAGADYLIGGDFAFLGQDMNVNLKLMDVNAGTIIPFSIRGYTENTVHELAEGVIEELTGEPIILQGTDGERSILSLSDEEPGSIEFYCNFEDGEIFVDEEFYGYTPGGTIPTLLEDLSPGEHTIRVEAGWDFGEVILPQMEFRDWERTVKVKADRKSVVRAVVRHFNSQIYDEMRIYRKNWRVGGTYENSLTVRDDASYIDMEGRHVPVYVELDANVVNGEILMTFRIEADGVSKEWTIDSNTEDIDIDETVGIIEFEFERDWYSNSYWDFDIELERTDLYQGMHRE